MSEGESSHNEPSFSACHLEYLDEFLRLRCAPDLVSMGLFPNAKEITETFAVWAAIRRHILPKLTRSSSSNGSNAMIVVGDGMTPRTAGLCAYLTKGAWQCYSIDPMLQYDTYADRTFIPRQSWTTADHCDEWKSTAGLRMARARIQTVSVPCRQAIVVLMHAHVSIADAMAAVDASEGIVGIVTCPCCQWAPSQQEWLGHAPHQQYADRNLLSSKNQMNVWCFPQGCPSKPHSNLKDPSTTITTTTEEKPLSVDRSAWGVSAEAMENVLATRGGVKQRAVDLWPRIFSHGIKAFNATDMSQSSGDSDAWPWATTAWSPADICSLMQSCDVPSTSLWLGKPILLVGTIVAVRRCKHTVFYELTSCALPSEPLEDLLRPAHQVPSQTEPGGTNSCASKETFPMILKSAERIWTCVEYQRHLQAILAYDPSAERKTKKRNLPTATVTDPTDSSSTDRVNIVLSLLPFQDQLKSAATSQPNDRTKVKPLNQNPQSRLSLFPWAVHLRAGDILVAYCELGRNASQGPQLCVVDGILLFDSILHLTGIDRRILR